MSAASLRNHGPTLILAALLAGCGGGDDETTPQPSACAAGDPGCEAVLLLRDDYGVPHVFASTREQLAYGWGFADAEDMRDEMVLLASGGEAKSSARFGAACGEKCAQADGRALEYRVPESVQASYGTLEEGTRLVLEAYADGANAFLRGTPSPHYDPEQPITAVELVGALVLTRIQHARAASQAGIDPAAYASNQFAATGDRTAGDGTILLKDPHNGWTSSERYVHLHGDGLDIVGNGIAGIIGCGGSSALAVGCTRASPAPAIAVEVALQYVGENPGEAPCGPFAEYRYFDHAAANGAGDFVPFSARCVSLDTGDLAGVVSGWLFDTRFGTVEALGEDADVDGHPDTAIVTHVFAATDVSILDYQVARTFAKSADELLALFAAPLPREDAQYQSFATADGHVGLILGAAVPALDPDVDWSNPVSSADPRIDSWTPNADWSDTTGVAFYNIDGGGLELPHVVDPAGDFVENCNGNPTYATEPTGQIGDVPAFLEIATGPSTRDLRLHELLAGSTDIDAGKAQTIATDVTVGVGQRLGESIRCGLEATGDDPAAWGDGGVLMQELVDWGDEGYEATPESTGMTVMFLLDAAAADPVYPDPGACLDATQLDALGVGLRDVVAPYMRGVYATLADPLRVPWGYVNYVVVAGQERGLPGAVGGGGRIETLFVSFFAFDTETGRAKPETHGGSRVTQIVAYGGGFHTFVTSPHGQVNEQAYPSSPHVGQTIEDFAARRMREVRTAQADVEAHLCPYGDSDRPEHDPSHEHVTKRELSRAAR